MSPEADDGQLLVQLLLVLREVHSEESTDALSRQLSRRPTEDAKEHGGEELNLEQEAEEPSDLSSAQTSGLVLSRPTWSKSPRVLSPSRNLQEQIST